MFLRSERQRNLVRCVLILCVAAMLLGCSSTNSESPADSKEHRDSALQRDLREGEIFIEGNLTDEGVECQALRTDDGVLYTLVGVPQDHLGKDYSVWVIGTAPEMSICMQGTTLKVVEIGLR